MPDYQKAKIYKIVDLNEEMVYIGSTSQTLCRRMSDHKKDYKIRKDKFTVHNIFDKYGIENCKILLIENYPCESRTELEKREGEIIKSLVCVNKIIAGRTPKERYEDNKDEILKRNRLYEIKNKEKINKQRRDNYQNKKST